MHPIVEGMMQLFAGFTKAYGIYGKELVPQEGSKKLKGKAYSIAGDVTVELWEKHISGTQSLGIIPINEKSQVKFAAIDVDEYPIDIARINKRLQIHKLPLIPCTTKSGGVHLYLFLKEFHNATEVLVKMREFAAVLGYGGSEIFPKQTTIVAERGDIGQWINMPYFDATQTTRYALNRVNEKMGITEFIKAANELSVSYEELLKVVVAVKEVLPGGPPCLNQLCESGFPEGTRNNGLFNLGVYAKKSRVEGWESFTEELNHLYMNPPLGTNEVLGVIKSLRKKDFAYMCRQPPISSFCNLAKCRGCQFGVGPGTGMPRLGSLTKILTDPPIWFIDVEGGGRLELATEDLQNQVRFQTRCLATLNVMPSKMKSEVWEEIVRNLLETVTIVEVPQEAKPSGQLREFLEDFCLSRAAAHDKEEILLGKPWLHDGYHYFRLRDFLDFLERRKFRQVQQQYIAMFLDDWGAKKKFMLLRGKGVNCYLIPEIKNVQSEQFDARKFENPEVI